MDKLTKKHNPLLDKLILAYNENELDEVTQVSLNNKELKALILYTTGGIAWEDTLDYELFNRRELKQEFQNSKK